LTPYVVGYSGRGGLGKVGLGRSGLGRGGLGRGGLGKSNLRQGRRLCMTMFPSFFCVFLWFLVFVGLVRVTSFELLKVTIEKIIS